ncbi:MAG: choice-of-anchor D domain-containing protein, partial [Verrucomicrobiae bacterium]|nr:choice-of-anchor D domain-containing protein [Verrucomicrobiae bacterium]
GTGLAPDVAVEAPLGTPILPSTPGGANLGSVSVNKVASVTFNITNPGNSNLTLSNVSLGSGTSSAVTIKSNLTSTTVAPGGSSQFTLQFAPTTTGSFTGSVSIPTNVTGKNPYVISFTGTGVDAIPNTDAFGYSMDVAAPATEAAYLKATDPDVLVPGGLLVDDASLQVDIGFSFKFYDKAYTKCHISTNGLISFDQGVTAWSPTAIPSTDLPDNYIAPFWSDLNPGAGGGAILYATRGTAPNRTFIIKWEEMPEYYTPTRKVTFQLTLYEGSNSIEVQYKNITAGFGDTRTYVGMGIESRNYGAIQPQPASNVIGLRAAHGLVDSANKDIDGNPIKNFPYAIRYTRPVVFTVESNYQKPTALDPQVTTTEPTPLTGPGDLSIFPAVKTHYGTPIGTNKRFEAPEAIYLDKNFNKLAGPGALDGPAEQIAWYRLVNDGYAIDGQVVQGTHAFFSTTLNQDVTVVWRWRLEYAAIIESGKPNGGAVNDGGRQWFKPGDQFTAIIDSPLDGIAESSGMRLIVQGYSMFDRDGAQIGTEVPVTAGAYVSSNPYSMNQPVRLRWRWAGQVRYRFGAVNDAGSLLGQAFVRVYDGQDPSVLQATT